MGRWHNNNYNYKVKYFIFHPFVCL